MKGASALFFRRVLRRIRYYRNSLTQWAAVRLDFAVRWRARSILARGRYKVLWFDSSGLGDLLMLAPVAAKLREEGDVILVCPEPLVVPARRIRAFTEVLAPNVARSMIPQNSEKILRPTYRRVYEEKHGDKNLIDYLAESVGLANVTHEISYELKARDRKLARTLKSPYLVFHTDTLSFREKKSWPHEYWQQLIDMQELPVVVLGGWPFLPFRNCIDLRYKTTVHEAAAIIESCQLFVGVVSGLYWFTRVFERPAIAINGGFEPPILTSHPLSSHLSSPDRSGYCLEATKPCCEGACMSSIKPGVVNAEILKRQNL